jgi:hypothetical protein
VITPDKALNPYENGFWYYFKYLFWLVVGKPVFLIISSWYVYFKYDVDITDLRDASFSAYRKRVKDKIASFEPSSKAAKSFKIITKWRKIQTVLFLLMIILVLCHISFTMLNTPRF